MRVSYYGSFGSPSPDGIIRGYGWTDGGDPVDLVWVVMEDEPYRRADWETYTFILDELGKGKPYTPKMMRSLKDSRLKQMLLEEICRRAV
jgi:hypothetical protein